MGPTRRNQLCPCQSGRKFKHCCGRSSEPRSIFPDRPAFHLEPENSQVRGIALRLVVNLFTDEPAVVGTATQLNNSLLVTAKHVLNDIPGFDDIFKQRRSSVPLEFESSLHAVQTIPGEDGWIVWSISDVTLSSGTDIALLVVNNAIPSHHERPIHVMRPRVEPFAPIVGRPVGPIGHRLGTIQVSKEAGRHIKVDSELTTSIGVVREVFEFGRDRILLPFPCYRVGARFDGGMSGGPVFDEKGALCGVVCNNFEGLDGEPVSHVSALWPLFCFMVNDSSGKPHRVIDLARMGSIAVTDFWQLDRYVAAHGAAIG